MKSTLILIGWTLISLQCAFAQTIKDPIEDYLTSRDINRDPEMPNLKKLFVVKCDLNNSEKLSILISFNGYGGRQGNFWTVYLPTSNGYVKADDSKTVLTFRQDTFFIGLVDGKYGLLAYAPGRNAGDLNLFQITDGKVTEQKVASLDLSRPQDQEKFKAYFGEPSNWKSLKNYPIKIMSLDDLKRSDYDVDAAIKAAQTANHPLHKLL